MSLLCPYKKQISISILDSEEIRASQVEPVKPAKCSESSNPAGSWLFHDDDDLWQLGLFAKIERCVSRFITIVKGVNVYNDNVAMFSPLAPIKISSSIDPPGAMRAQFRLIIKYVAGYRRSTRARRIARIKYAKCYATLHCDEYGNLRTWHINNAGKTLYRDRNPVVEFLCPRDRRST